MASSKMAACGHAACGDSTVDSSYQILDDGTTGDLLYSLRRHNPEMYVHYEGKEKTPKEMKEAVVGSERLQRVMEQISQQSGRSRVELEAEVHALLEEMGHKFFMPALRMLAFVIRKGLRHISKGIYVNKEGVDMVKEAVRKWPVVLLPSHRSYLDFILISYVFLHFNLRLPVIAAGQDFMEMAGVSAFLRRSGAFFMRRTFGSDQLYWSVFTEYVQQHLTRGYAPVEFFIEGTRSRTAKSLHPKLGLLSVIVEPYLLGHLADVMLVPISISYERTLEEELFSRELLGVPKPKESTKGLFKATSILSEDYGKIFITFNAPMSLHDYFLSLGVSSSGRALLLRGVSTGQAESRKLVLETGYEVIARIHSGLKLPTSALVATVLLHNTSGVQMDDLVKRAMDLSCKVRVHGGKLMDTALDREVVATTCARLHASVEVLPDELVRPLTRLPQGLPLQGPQIAKGLSGIAQLSIDSGEMDVLLNVATVHLTLAHYRNQLLHLFATDMVLAAALQGGAGAADKGAVFERYKMLTAVLDKEFIFPRGESTELQFQQVLQSFVDRGMIKLRYSRKDPTAALIAVRDAKAVQFLADLVYPFVAGVWITCGHLLTLSGGVDSVAGVLKRTQLLAAKCVMSGAVRSAEVLSLDVVRNTLAALTQMALLSQVQGEFNTGKERLVKVLKQHRLQEAFDLLGSVVNGYHQEATSSGTAHSLKARL